MAAQVETYKTILSEFIDLYRSMPCLWKVKSKEYLDRNKKERAYDVLANKLKQVDPKADRDKVVKKINNLRSSFRKELKKYHVSKQNETNPEEVYTPRLWYFDTLLFLTDHDQDETDRPNNRSPVSFLDEQDAAIHDLYEDDSESKEDPFALLNVSVLPAELTTFSASSDLKVINHSDEGRMPEVATKRLASIREEDDFDIIAKNIANKLRKLTPLQVVVTEKRINDILFEAQMENLQESSKLYAHHSPSSTLTDIIKSETTE